jgi:DNA (cytosine-5)-methyltransferase 1
VAVDLFAGAGGFSLGALLAEIRVVAAIEQDKHACATYRQNLITSGRTTTKLFEQDIMELDPLEVMAATGLRPGDCDILLGGPPCQGFSSHRLNDAGVDDPRNKLLLHYFKYVKALRPRFFLVENVPGMLWPRHKSYVDTFYRLARKNGYDLPKPFILNARSFGVPQNRRRAFLLGFDQQRRSPLSWPPEETHIDPAHIPDSAGQSRSVFLPWNTARTVFDKPAPNEDPNDIHMTHNAELTRAFRRTPINGGSRRDSGRVLPCHVEYSGHSDVYGRINPDVPGPTMTTACINPSKGRFVHPTEPHGITLRQAARFQTFPDWFEFKGGLMAGGVQAGNAVPVEMATALLRPLAEACRHDPRPATAPAGKQRHKP